MITPPIKPTVQVYAQLRQVRAVTGVTLGYGGLFVGAGLPVAVSR